MKCEAEEKERRGEANGEKGEKMRKWRSEEKRG